MSTSEGKLTTEQQESLIAAARIACGRAYAPYSKFHVGAAILLHDNQIFCGCNVENASYGLTNCAERSAIFAAVSALGAAAVKIRALAVVNERNVACSPCGACRQVISEFGPQAEIFYLGPKGIMRSTIRELLPDCFSADSL